jgi:hypothetical protein
LFWASYWVDISLWPNNNYDNNIILARETLTWFVRTCLSGASLVLLQQNQRKETASINKSYEQLELKSIEEENQQNELLTFA